MFLEKNRGMMVNACEITNIWKAGLLTTRGSKFCTSQAIHRDSLKIAKHKDYRWQLIDKHWMSYRCRLAMHAQSSKPCIHKCVLANTHKKPNLEKNIHEEPACFFLCYHWSMEWPFPFLLWPPGYNFIQCRMPLSPSIPFPYAPSSNFPYNPLIRVELTSGASWIYNYQKYIRCPF